MVWRTDQIHGSDKRRQRHQHTDLELTHSLTNISYFGDAVGVELNVLVNKRLGREQAALRPYKLVALFRAKKSDRLTVKSNFTSARRAIAYPLQGLGKGHSHSVTYLVQKGMSWPMANGAWSEEHVVV